MIPVFTRPVLTRLLIIQKALKSTDGSTGDAATLLKAMQDVRLSHGPIGPVRLDEYGTPVLDIYIRKVARVDGKLVNTILKDLSASEPVLDLRPSPICPTTDVLA
jgi:hypothetical protein